MISVSYAVVVAAIVVMALLSVFAAFMYDNLQKAVKTNNGLYNRLKEGDKIIDTLLEQKKDLSNQLEMQKVRASTVAENISGNISIPEPDRLKLVSALLEKSLNERLQDKRGL